MVQHLQVPLTYLVSNYNVYACMYLLDVIKTYKDIKVFKNMIQGKTNNTKIKQKKNK